MSKGRYFISAALAVALTACGGGDSGSSSPGPIGGGGGGVTPTPSPTSQCTLSARQDWAKSVIDTYYLFPTLVAQNVAKSNFNTVQGYIDALVAPARAQNRDRYFTYLTSIEEEERAAQGQTAGLGIRLGFDENNRLLIAEAFEDGPAFKAGIDRGTEITSINGESVTTLVQERRVYEALGASDAGVTVRLDIIDSAGTSRQVTVTKADYYLDPVSNRYGLKIIGDGGKKVGYVNLRTFFSLDAPDDLRAVFAQLRTQGITEVILDLRYNGGGYINVADLLGDLMGRGKEGQVFSRTVFRPSRASLNETRFFEAQPEAIGVTKLAVIGTEATASASELVTNAFIPYLGDNLALVGSNTYGKPVGQEGFDQEACDDRLRVVSLKTENSNGNGEYYTGLASVVPNFCRATDELAAPFGSREEDSVATALDFLAGRGCSSVAAAPGQQATRSVAPPLNLLRPDAPNAAQYQIPGLF
ncbi:S41 family peptidase [Qipengyuania atrilutea]|uniref:PDZ domain-containing protein n=1 Tax=Qipengyuania atrilutea TaxID=2744473 RepID=A0A850H5P5_9SPHN|nr:S41 family peptidase [Actirhodobacter atriluteus]NVD45817.1 PDZ domain-containing protein [Actirhodobacter atriluteus]